MTNHLRAPHPQAADQHRPTPEYAFINQQNGEMLYPQTANGLYGHGRVESDQREWVDTLTEHARDHAEPINPVEEQQPIDRAAELRQAPVEILVESKEVIRLRDEYELVG